MTLTPEDVSNKRFTPVRLREGYDMGEVDQFLDEVEASLEQLTKENEDLRNKLSAAQKGSPVEAAAPAPVEPKPEPVPVPAVAPIAATPAPAAATAPQEIKVSTVGEASSAAAKLLEIATRNADELVVDAKEEADKIVGAARTKAERLDGETKTKTDRLEQDARTRAAMLDSETEARRKEIFGGLDKEKDNLAAEIESLRSFEREYRSRLRNYFTQQLETLDGNGESAGTPGGAEPVHSPKRLKSILGEESEDSGS